MYAVVTFLVNNHVVTVDESEWSRIANVRWYAMVDKSGLVYIQNGRIGRLSRFLVDAPKGLHVDHINGNTLDNRRANLRICTHAQNQWNRKRSPGRSKFKGVSHCKSNSPAHRWFARIAKHGHRRFLGSFATQEDAARAYDAAAKTLFGEYAGLNFPDT